MNEVKHLTDQHRRALKGQAWHGPPLLEVLDGVTTKRAMARPVKKAHTIWEIVLHIEAWDRVVVGRLTGKPIELSDEENWPRVRDTSPRAWKRAVRSMQSVHGKLNREIAKLTPARLDQGYGPKRQYKLFRLVHGVVHHELYHAGQIAILKKG